MNYADRIRMAALALQASELATSWSLRLAWRKRAQDLMKGL